MVNISIVKSSVGKWTLKYQANKPVSRLGFSRNPDSSRMERWRPKTSDFKIVSIEKQEYLIKKDGSTFTEVSLNLTPTYKHLSKDYAPFSPYSDGGTLIHTARLFACVNTCTDEIEQWRFSMQVPIGEHIVVGGKVYTGMTSWLDSRDGTNVYVGHQKPVETQNIITVIDNGLPKKMKLSLDSDIPNLMNYFKKHLGKTQGIKPTLFASYANVDGQSSQGGTLPNQIFMHWNVNNLNEKMNDDKFLNDTIWFFAHEVAHLYQRSNKRDIYGDVHESWLHEGHADWLAASVLLELYPETQQHVSNKINSFRSHCAEGLSDMPLRKAADENRFDLYYSCGLLIHQAIDAALQKTSEYDIHSLWINFREQVENGEPKGIKTFLALTEELTSADLVNKIREIINNKLTNPDDALNQLIPNA